MEEELRQDVLGGNGARTGMQHKKEREWSCKKLMELGVKMNVKNNIAID